MFSQANLGSTLYKKKASESKQPAGKRLTLRADSLSSNCALCLCKKKRKSLIPQPWWIYLCELCCKKKKNGGTVDNELSRLSVHCCSGNKGVLAEISVSAQTTANMRGKKKHPSENKLCLVRGRSANVPKAQGQKMEYKRPFLRPARLTDDLKDSSC